VRAVLQRVQRAAVVVEGETVGEITEPGLFALVGVGHDDGQAEVELIVRKIADLRLLEGERSVTDAGAPVLVVSQFTLLADTRKGNRPSFTDAAPPDQAEPLVDAFCAALRAEGVSVATGVFGAKMEVELVNDGPVTIVLEL
jgi:D-tyrosyl-tRNA(Tyr) deacylase